MRIVVLVFFFFKQKTAYEMRISDWSSDVCSSDLFLKIAELSSLSKAAEELDLSQSGLSRQLAGLEALLGQALFVRTGRGVALTEAGEKLQQGTRLPFAQIDTALEAVKIKDGVTDGSLRVATIHTLSHYFASDLLARFVSQHRTVNLSVMARSSPDVVDLVEKGRADLGLERKGVG